MSAQRVLPQEASEETLIRCQDGPDKTIFRLAKEPLVPPRKDDTNDTRLGRNRLPAWQYCSWSPEQPVRLLPDRYKATIRHYPSAEVLIQDEPESQVTEDTCGKSEKESMQNHAETRKKAQLCPHGSRSKPVPPVRILNMNRMVLYTVYSII